MFKIRIQQLFMTLTSVITLIMLPPTTLPTINHLLIIVLFLAETGHGFGFSFLGFGACHCGFGFREEAGSDGIFAHFTAASCYAFELMAVFFFVRAGVEAVARLPDYCFGLRIPHAQSTLSSDPPSAGSVFGRFARRSSLSALSPPLVVEVSLSKSSIAR